MASVRVGFTGTRKGLSQDQSCNLLKLLKFPEDRGVFCHGDCIGADAQAHDIANSLHWKIKIYPPENSKYRAFKEARTIYRPRHYLERNKIIVDKTSRLIVCPNENEEILRSGTWSTFRYAKSLFKKIIVLLPDGNILLYND